MHIKTIVLDGFKSFGRKTEIPFYEDFTTVSGPNGSGKSNIIDGVLFALGLARTRGIRAEKLTDLIYNPGHHGDDADQSGPREASVEVVLDNSDRTLSRSQVVSAAGTEKIGDVDEISIRRRVKETADNYYSYYYLNERAVNLSDVQDLLAAAGVTPEGYNVVMQGDVTEIINMTAGQRREILDEIAGVAEFDAKKADAMGELEIVEDRIGEADLRIEEKEGQLEQLADERETALEYQGLRDEKREYEGYLKAAELKQLRDDLAATREDAAEREAKLDSHRVELDRRQGKVVRIQEDIEDLNAEIERTGEDEQLALKAEIEEIKGEIDRLDGRIETERERIEEAEQRRREAFVELDRKNETVEELDDELRDVKVEKASLKAEKQDLKVELARITAEIEAVGEEYEELTDALEERKSTLETVREEKNEHRREKDRLLDEARRRSNEAATVERELDEVRERLPELDAELADLTDELANARENERQIEGVVEDLAAERRELADDLDAVEDDIQAAQAEYAELEAKAGESGDASYGRAVTTVLNADFDGVHGTVGQLGGVEEQYATACETAAGGRLANVVVDDDGVGQRCIEHLKTTNAGRATFLPLSEMYSRSLPSAPNDDGVVGFAYDLVEFDDEYTGVFSYVLGDTLVVDNLDTARAYMGEYRMVTLSGELVEKSGAMTGGSRSGSRYSFSKTGKGRLERVAERITDLHDERESIRASIRDLEERLDRARDRRSDAADAVRSIEGEIERREETKSEVEARIDDLTDRLDEIEAERQSVDREMADIDDAIADHDAEIERIESDVAELEAELADSKIPALQDEREAVRGEIDDLDDRTDDLDARLNELALEKRYVEEAIEDLESEIETAKERRAESEDRIEKLEAEIDDHEGTLVEKHEEVEALEEQLAELKDDREDLRETLREAEADRDEKRETVSSMENRLKSLRRSETRLEVEIERLEPEVDEYDPDEIPDHDEVERNVNRLEREMAKLEPVNMRAIDRYDEVESELNDLQERREILVEERDGIADRIDAYEARKRETFMDAFEGIDAHFQDIFEQLSNGTGQLHLENEDEPFEGGLTMKAEPGDKPIQRLDAMSGGEKSLTALAFIFAIQRYNPAPFYALDEVDAFLDAANADRVGELVDELADDAQFVVVSHRSAMLERSERAIGVTMQENNVSAVTGIEFAAEATADD